MSWLDSFFQVGGTVTLAGDVTGASGANTVAKFSGATVPGSTAAGLFLVGGSPTTWTSRAIAGSDLPMLTGDVLWNTAPATQVVGLGTGISTVAAHCTNLTFDAGAGRVVNVAQSASGAGDSLSLYGGAAKTGSAAAGGDAIFGSGAGDGAGAVGKVRLRPGGSGGNDALICDGTTLTYKSGTTTLGTSFLNSGTWAFQADAGLSGFQLIANAPSQSIALSCTGASGYVRLYAPQIQFYDGTGTNTLIWALSSTGATTATVAAGATFTWQQTAAAGAAVDTTFKPQRAGTGTSGSYVVDVGLPGSGTGEAGIIVKRNGTPVVFLGPYQTSGASYTALHLLPNGVAPDSLNPVIYGDGVNTYFSTAGGAGGIYSAIHGVNKMSLNGDVTNALVFVKSLAGTFGTAPQTTDVAPPALTVSASSAWASALTNTTGGTLNVNSGKNTDGTTYAGFALAPATISTVISGLVAGTQQIVSTSWTFAADSARGGLLFQANATNQIVQFQALGSGNSGIVYFDAATLNMRDGGAAQTIAWSLAHLGASSATIAAGVTSFFLGYASGVQLNLTSTTALSLGSTAGVNTLLGGMKCTTITVANTNRTLDTTTTDCVIFVSTSSATVQLTLPSPANGRRFRIIDIGGNLSGNNLTLARFGSEKINGSAASKVFSTNWGQWEVWTNGTDWFVG